MVHAQKLRRGIYLLPTLFTVGNLYCGFASVLEASRGDFAHAAVLIVLAAVLDGLDGRIARLTGTTSNFGNEFDSLADIVSFGVAPAFLVYRFSLVPYHRIGVWLAFVYVVGAAMRLARFNIQSRVVDRRFFAGLPSPAAACVLASMTLSVPQSLVHPWKTALASGLVLTAALLMVSRVRYRSFKDLDLRNRRSYSYVLPLAALTMAVVAYPEGALPLILGIYMMSGPASYAWGVLRRGRAAQATVEAGAAETPEALDGNPTR